MISFSKCLQNHIYNKIKKNLDELINLSKTMERGSQWIRKTYITCVDLTELYHGKLNFSRYCIEWSQLFMIVCGLIANILTITNHWVYDYFVDNEFLPKNFKIIILFATLILIIAI